MNLLDFIQISKLGLFKYIGDFQRTVNLSIDERTA